MPNARSETSLRPRAQLTGVIDTLYFATAILGEVLFKKAVVSGNAGATGPHLLVRGVDVPNRREQARAR